MVCISLGSFKVVCSRLTTTQHVVQPPSTQANQGPQGCVCSWSERRKSSTEMCYGGVSVLRILYENHGKQSKELTSFYF